MSNTIRKFYYLARPDTLTGTLYYNGVMWTSVYANRMEFPSKEKATQHYYYSHSTCENDNSFIVVEVVYQEISKTEV